MTGNEIRDARLFLYGLCRSFFDSYPTEEKFNYWLKLADLLKDGIGFPPIDTALFKMNETLKDLTLTQIQNEYYELFENPFSSKRVQLCASYYIDGKLMGKSLVKLKKLLYNLNLGKESSFKESEDHLVFLIDAMMFLIESEKGEEAVSSQAELFHHFLLPCGKGVFKCVSEIQGLKAYSTFTQVLNGALELEGVILPSL